VWLGETKRRIYACSEPTDMRESFHGLLVLVQHVFSKQDPYSGDLFVFVNRRGNYIKILAWGLGD
jgi:transposase